MGLEDISEFMEYEMINDEETDNNDDEMFIKEMSLNKLVFLW